MKVNIKQISEATGFSQATVSNALNAKRGVNAETATLILRTAKQMGYFGEEMTEKIRFVIFTRNGIVETNTYFPTVIAGVERACRECNMEVVLTNLDRRSRDYEEKVRQLHSDPGAAVIILGTEMQDEDLGLIQGFHVPVVVVDYWNRKMLFNAVVINNEDSVRWAVEYLLEMGHRKIGYLKGNQRLVPFQERERGFRAAMQEYGLELQEKWVVPLRMEEGAESADGIYRDMKRYLENTTELPTVFFAEDDTIALAALKALLEHGVKVPEEVSLLGFDDIAFSSLATPALTTFHVPKQEIGGAAVYRALEMMKGKSDAAYKIQVCTHLVERESVRRL
ncbi:MAG: LacI family DNA-binding transcriptional regulator [Eubacteriales bacterium]|nr:LacI family DNA-binding transcriptional regulator [Eubacteriales bacterium]